MNANDTANRKEVTVSREHIERVIAERVASGHATAGAQDAKTVLRVARAQGTTQELRRELQVMLCASVPPEYASAWVETVFNEVLNNREHYTA